jgi:hypothetical protein
LKNRLSVSLNQEWGEGRLSKSALWNILARENIAPVEISDYFFEIRPHIFRRRPGGELEGNAMVCLVCKDLEQAFNAVHSEYDEARSSMCYRFTRKFAALKYVDMERAKSALEEHKLHCDSGVKGPERAMSGSPSRALKLIA